ncbi:uncharacterized protein MONBRDRAFT_18386 [Monosiga brevicollis MX1]|uniref:Uncharacterized protein n=1 Tax=Monosiga brevicollis TaxID=81824 RepID=A9UVD8_MONBE|nr:uncharacterized protein MONBRDRAFT_18386 [Monosiga brevicollis MX1]EDQ90564.1 predicted protein [Monosiga brevicollis MX1]|eukprot:XP_001744615.1 hypothetical protein [Monosiga brevicollis MX1]
MTPSYWQQLERVGFGFQVSSFLSTAGDEDNMLEDMVVGMDDLKNIVITVSAVDGSEFDPVIRGRRWNFELDLGIPVQYWPSVTENLKRGQAMAVYPVLFSQGVNEMQTIANLVGDSKIQDVINRHGFEAMREYAERYMAAFPDDPNCSAIREHMRILHQEVATRGRTKNVEMLWQAERLARSMNMGRTTCCKSGKDRTSMAVTLEEVTVMRQFYEIDEITKESVLSNLRSKGVRIENVLKNIGEKRYAFNVLQVQALPAMLRPPDGYYGSSTT